MNNENKEFFDLLNEIVKEQTFDLNLTPKKLNEQIKVKCKELSTAQLKELIQTIVDSPLTQTAFNSTVSKVFKQSLVEDVDVSLNVVDRLLFIIETRIQTLSSTMTITNQEQKTVVHFDEIKNKLEQTINENPSSFLPETTTEGKLTAVYGVPLIDTEIQLDEEVYSHLRIDTENVEELRKVIGETFINEIAKSFLFLTIENKTLDFSTLTFAERLKTIETLPASLIQKVILYIEKYKKAIESCLTVEGTIIPIDGSVFSLH